MYPPDPHGVKKWGDMTPQLLWVRRPCTVEFIKLLLRVSVGVDSVHWKSNASQETRMLRCCVFPERARTPSLPDCSLDRTGVGNDCHMVTFHSRLNYLYVLVVEVGDVNAVEVSVSSGWLR